MNIDIRREIELDYTEVFNVIKKAFENAEHSDGNEQNLVTKLRKSSSFIPELSLVADYNGKIVGHILFSKVKIGDSIQIALAPVSVLPEFQKQGIGSKLIREGHKIAKELGYKISVVLGHEKYYPKFGYEIASKLGIEVPFDVPIENFMVLNLSNEKCNIKGTVEYAKEFFE